ncbi:MAG TPA: hypothetical protein VFV23_00380 [Verrucomicrobiae bacterium]|nr:hypothetical protein [Verrucomicrobiae bacterium]
MRNHLPKFIAAGFAASLLLGCHREESQIQIYRVAKDAAPAMAMQASASMPDSSLPPGHPDISGGNAAAPATENASSPLTFTKPDGWTEVAPSEMRVASFKVNQNGKMADVSVIPLPGMAGSDLANVNRWRGQVGLSPVSADELQKSAQSLEISGEPAQLYDIAGQNPASGDSTRILGVIQHHEGSEWFFKMTGDADLVEAQKPAFIQFLKSVKFTGATVASGMNEMPSSLPPGHPQIGDMNSAMESSGPISHEGQPNWNVPSDWKEVSGGQFLVAKFLINNDAAAVNVSMSAGDGGGLDANVNRWRGQLGLQPAAVSATPLEVTSGKGELVELNGTNVQNGQSAQLVAVMVSQSDRAWFYKLMGDPKTVAAQKAAFLKFVQSAKY